MNVLTDLTLSIIIVWLLYGIGKELIATARVAELVDRLSN